jgi:prevent-host-death family protein
MATVTLRELARNMASVIQGVQASGRPALVTRNGKPVVALVPINEAALEDWLLTQSAEITQMAAAADPDLDAARSEGAEWRRARDAEVEHGEAAPPASVRSALRGSHRGD